MFATIARMQPAPTDKAVRLLEALEGSPVAHEAPPERNGGDPIGANNRLAGRRRG